MLFPFSGNFDVVMACLFISRLVKVPFRFFWTLESLCNKLVQLFGETGFDNFERNIQSWAIAQLTVVEFFV